jgi:hypothetical protein
LNIQSTKTKIMPDDKKVKKKTAAERKTYTAGKREEKAASVRAAAGNSRLQAHNMKELRKADSAAIKASQEASSSTFRDNDYKKIKKGMQR